MIPYDPALTSSHYLGQAMGDPALPEALLWMAQPAFDFGINNESLATLLNPIHWRRKPPRVSISASWNNSGNIRIMWEPHTSNDFVEVEDRELFWFRAFKLTIDQAQNGSHGALMLMYGHVARYAEVVAQIGSKMQVLRSSRIIPFYEPNVDISEGPT